MDDRDSYQIEKTNLHSFRTNWFFYL